MCLNGLFEVEGPDTENGLSYARIYAFQKYCEGHACLVFYALRIDTDDKLRASLGSAPQRLMPL